MDNQNIFSEFNDPIRVALIKKIAAQVPHLKQLRRGWLFPFWFAEISELEACIDSSGAGQKSTLSFIGLLKPDPDYAGMFAGKRQVHNDLKNKNGKGERDTSSTDMPTSESHAADSAPSVLAKDACSEWAKEEALRRDGNQCVLTEHGRLTLEVSYIVPFEFNGSPREAEWAWLECFWGKTKVSEWRSAILGKGESLDTEKIENLFCLAESIHRYWDYSICAFRPISINNEKTSMHIAFHWLPLREKLTSQRNDFLPIDKHPYPDNPTGFTETPGENIFVFHMITKQVVPSGYIFQIKTDDPKKRPLPSFALLEMQWHLSRIVAMQGAGESDESDDDDDIVTVYSRSRSRSCSPERTTSPCKEISARPVHTPARFLNPPL
jgi:hypothetical protein